MKIAAYCNCTDVALAKAISIATQMTWKKSDNNWTLIEGETKKFNDTYYNGKKYLEYLSLFQKLQPEMIKKSASEKMLLIAEAPWNKHLKGAYYIGSFKWNDLTPEQKQYIRKQAKSNASLAGLITHTDTAVFEWHSHIRFFVLSNSILVDEGVLELY